MIYVKPNPQKLDYKSSHSIIELTLPANDQTGNFLEAIIDSFEAKKVIAFCVKQGSHFDPELPALFDVAFGELLELDEFQPFAK